MKRSASFWKISGGILGLCMFLVILIAANKMLGAFRLRTDLTENKIYTLSQGTRAILDRLDSTVTLKFFFSSSIPEIAGPIKLFAAEVERLLKEYEIAAKGKIVVEKYDPKPDTEIEEWAARYGLVGQPLGIMGPDLYLGLVAVKGDSHDSIPFFDPRQERLMEYDITRLILRVSSPGKPAIGVMSGLPVMGEQAMPFAMPGQPPKKSTQPWIAFQELAQDYDTRKVPIDAAEIEGDISALILVHPKNLSPQTLFAIDQFVLRGGRLLAFLDPLCLTESRIMPDDPSTRMSPPASTLEPLASAWGIISNPGMILADLAASTPVSQGMNRVEESPVFLTLREENINKSNTVTAQINSLIMACAGAFSYSKAEPIAGLDIEPLLTSSRQSQMLDAMAAQMGTDWIRRNFKSQNENMSLALRLAGRFKTAFPDGMPPSEPAAETEDEVSPDSDSSEFLTESAKPTTVILVYDVDMLYDEFAVRELSFFGHRAYQPINDNMYLLATAVEQLAGGPDLADVRARGRFERPFHKVLALQREAQEQWMAREQALQEQLESTRSRLEALQSDSDKSQRFILSPEQQAEIERFRQEELKMQRELRNVRRNLREGIERLGVKVKVFNILFVPVLVCAAGVSFGLHRRYRCNR